MSSTPSARRMESGHWDALLFLGFAVLGSITMAILKWSDIPQSFVTLIMVLAVFGYAAVIYHVPRFRLRLDQAGDNAYYLGLIFTLCSMIFALIEVGRRVGPDTEEGLTLAEAVIGDFGLALGTTLAGIICRVFLHQMRTDPGSVEEATRMELAEAASQMREQIRDLTTQFGSFFLKLQQQQQDYVGSLIEAQKHDREEFDKSLEQVRESTSKHISAAGELLKEANQRLSQQVNQCSTEVESTLETWRSINSQTQALSESFQNLPTAVENVSQTMERLSSTGEHQSDRLVALIGQLDLVTEKIAQAQKQLETSLEKTQSGWTASRDELHDQLKSTATATKELAELSKELGEHAKRSADAVLRSEDSAVKVLDSLSIAVDRFAKSRA